MLAGGSASRPPLTAHWFFPIYGDNRYVLRLASGETVVVVDNTDDRTTGVLVRAAEHATARGCGAVVSARPVRWTVRERQPVGRDGTDLELRSL